MNQSQIRPAKLIVCHQQIACTPLTCRYLSMKGMLGKHFPNIQFKMPPYMFCEQKLKSTRAPQIRALNFTMVNPFPTMDSNIAMEALKKFSRKSTRRSIKHLKLNQLDPIRDLSHDKDSSHVQPLIRDSLIRLSSIKRISLDFLSQNFGDIHVKLINSNMGYFSKPLNCLDLKLKDCTYQSIVKEQTNRIRVQQLNLVISKENGDNSQGNDLLGFVESCIELNRLEAVNIAIQGVSQSLFNSFAGFLSKLGNIKAITIELFQTENKFVEGMQNTLKIILKDHKKLLNVKLNSNETICYQFSQRKDLRIQKQNSDIEFNQEQYSQDKPIIHA